MESRIFRAILLAVTLFLAGCTEETQDDEDETTEGLDMFQFEASDSPEETVLGEDDDLVDILMTSGDDLDWTVLEVLMTSSDSDPVTCSPSNQNSSSPCIYDEDGSQYWSQNESITISENNFDFCGEGDIGGCDWTFQINKLGIGQESDKVLWSGTVIIQ